MRYYVPLIQPEAPEPSASPGWFGKLLGRSAPPSPPPAPASPERLGGVPFGLSPEQWPRCSDCGKSQSLLAQVAHDSDRLDLGRAGRMLLVFQCGHDPGMCETWEAGSGANAAFVVEPEALGTAPTALPDDNPPLEAAFAITGWDAREDTIPEARRAAYMDDDALGEMSDQDRDLPVACTRLGGVPKWVQSASEAPDGWTFVGQLDSNDGSRPNFGDGGIAYLFVRPRAGEVPEACMFWQCY